MKFIPLIFADILTKKVHFTFIVLSLIVAFFLYAYLSAIKQGFVGSIDAAGIDRMVVVDKVSTFNQLPIAYKHKIANLPGVAEVTEFSWFGGYYQDRKNTFVQYAVDPEIYFSMYPEFEMSEDQKEAWIKDREGAIIGKEIAERFGWEVGDRITLTTTIWENKDWNNDWEFNIRGILYSKTPNISAQGMLFHQKYFDEGRAWSNDLAGWYIVKAEDPNNLDKISNSIDEFFQNSEHETKTSPEKAYSRMLINQVGDIEAIFLSILGIVFVTLLMVTGSAMLQGIKDNLSETAVMCVIGFSSRLIAVLTIIESLVVTILGSAIGVLLAYLFCRIFGDPTNGLLPIFHLPNIVILKSFVLACVFGMLIGLLPMALILRLDKVQALRSIH